MFEYRLHKFLAFFQVNGNEASKLLCPKFSNSERFANLAGTTHKQWLAVYTAFPFWEQLDNVSFHAIILLCYYIFMSNIVLFLHQFLNHFCQLINLFLLCFYFSLLLLDGFGKYGNNIAVGYRFRFHGIVGG